MAQDKNIPNQRQINPKDEEAQRERRASQFSTEENRPKSRKFPNAGDDDLQEYEYEQEADIGDI